MSWLDLPLVSTVLTRTGIKPYIPTGPAGSARTRASLLSGGAQSGVKYTSAPLVEHPVIPLQIWGVQYDLDLVIVSDHPRYNMHEYARVQTPKGPVWLAKDALEENLRQSLIADVDNITSWLPELPIVRRQSPVQVVDNSTDRWLDLRFAYTNLENEPVEVHYEGPTPRSYQLFRNGSTMGHSAETMMAALDIPYKNFARRASIRINGEDRSIDKLLGLVKLQVVLKQTQGGLATSEIRLAPGRTDGVALTASYRDQDDGWQATDWVSQVQDNTRTVTQEGGFRTLSYRFTDNDGAWELAAMHTRQYGLDLPVSHVQISPPLPDMRRRFDGVHTSRFTLDINDQQTQAYGRLEAWWDGDVAHVKMVPEAPEWTADRPMLTTLTYDESHCLARIVRIPVA